MFETHSRAHALLTILLRVAYTIAHIPVLLNLTAALRISFPIEAAGILNTADQAGLVYEHVAAHGSGFTLTLFFFGIHLLFLGTLIWRTRILPALIGAVICLAGAGYILDVVWWIIAPEARAANSHLLIFLVILPALIGEGLLMFWLLIRGVRSAPPPVVT